MGVGLALDVPVGLALDVAVGENVGVLVLELDGDGLLEGTTTTVAATTRGDPSGILLS